MMYKYKEKVDMTYFKKIKKTVIDEVNEGDIVYLKVRSPLKYGNRHWEYYGKIIKKTNLFFDILQYTTGYEKCETEDIKRYEKNPKQSTKRWAKKSIIEIYQVKCQEKKELVEYSTNDINSIKDI